MAITFKQKNNESFFHELTYYQPDGTTAIDISDIDIYIELYDKNNVLIKRFENIDNIADGLIKVDPVNGLYSISESMANVKNWPIGLAKGDIVYDEDREDATEDFHVNIIRGRTVV